MVITKKYIGILLAALIALITAAAIFHSLAVKQTIAENNFKIILDAGHGGYAECFKTENKV